MFKRIQKINKTGTFRKADSLGKFEFKKLTVFYGLNAFGKTTIKDIFQSLTQNEPGILLGRTSIPDVPSVKQEVILTFEENEGETNFEFQNEVWNRDSLRGRIHVFDDEFIHKNLVTGSEITRPNKVQLSDFILGEAGVSLSESIRVLNKKVSDRKKELCPPPYFKNLSTEEEVTAFLEMQIKESSSALEKSKTQKENDKENLLNIEEIKNLKDIQIPKLKSSIDMTEIIGNINETFRRNYEEVTNEIKEKINNHLANHVSDETGLSWITKGFMKYKKENNCPFCGQTTEPVKDLMDAYGDYFNEEYKIFAGEISNNLREHKSLIDQNSLSIFSDFQTLLIDLGKYKKYSSEIENEINLNELKQAEKSMNVALKKEKESIMSAVAEKTREPHKKVEDFVLSKSFKDALAILNKVIAKTAISFDASLTEAKKLKAQYSSLTDEDINEKKINLQKEIAKIDQKIARLKEDSLCNKYIQDLKDIKTLEDQVKAAEENFESQQSGYIKQYFEELNDVYKKLGSEGFKLDLVSNGRGHKKIYELKIFYEGERVKSTDVSKSLSESDKRSMSLAIFLSKLKHIENPKEHIIVLDDPVVSFDDNRISTTVGIIKSLTEEFKQVILLTHYPSLIEKLLSTREKAAYFQITKIKGTNIIKFLELDRFILSDYVQAFKKIRDYIECEHTQDISKDCRVFLEEHLQIKFCEDIYKGKVVFGSLGKFLSDLKDKNLIDDKQYKTLKNFCDELNPKHHNFISNENEENIRNYAKNLIDELLKI